MKSPTGSARTPGKAKPKAKGPPKAADEKSSERATGESASRLIDQRIREGEQVAAGAFKALVKAAVARNVQPAKKR